MGRGSFPGQQQRALVLLVSPSFPHGRRVAGEWPQEHNEIIGEDRQVIAKQCGTSVEMLERDYSFAIEDLEDEGPKPAAEERALARALAPAGRRRNLRAA